MGGNGEGVCRQLDGSKMVYRPAKRDSDQWGLFKVHMRAAERAGGWRRGQVGKVGMVTGEGAAEHHQGERERDLMGPLRPDNS